MSNGEQTTMSFLDHLEELRTRLFRVAIGIVVMSVLSYYWASDIFFLLTKPLHQSGLKVEVIGTSPAEAFVVKLEVALLVGVLLSLPYSFYQLWLFVAPGLHEGEKKLAIPFVFFSTLFFILGVVFCYAVAFPFAFAFFLTEYESIGVSAAIRIDEYLSFVLTTLLVFGLVFELPVLTFFLARMRLISSQWLVQKGRYGIVAIFVVAAVLTPPDVVSQILLAVPLLILYGLCIGVCHFVEKRRG
jgi:sec-independent protein translocase protein TatC